MKSDSVERAILDSYFTNTVTNTATSTATFTLVDAKIAVTNMIFDTLDRQFFAEFFSPDDSDEWF